MLRAGACRPSELSAPALPVVALPLIIAAYMTWPTEDYCFGEGEAMLLSKDAEGFSKPELDFGPRRRAGSIAEVHRVRCRQFPFAVLWIYRCTSS